MPRIRTIKPEFWTDPAMVHLSPLARLFYIGTWNFAICDQGHLEDDPVRLKLQILPAENVDVADLIDTLVDAGRLTRIDVNGEPYLHVHNLAEHQKVDGRWTPRCPACTHRDSPKLTETPRASPKLNQPHPRKGREGKGREVNTCSSDDERDATPDPFADWWSHYPRKVGKGQAVRAYRAALKKTDANTLLEAIKAQAPKLTERGTEFCPYPATWLNGERWADETDTTEEADPWAHLPTVDQLVAERGF